MFTFQSTLPVRGATKDAQQDVYGLIISIHAPRAGSDIKELEDKLTSQISIHAPRSGSDKKSFASSP